VTDNHGGYSVPRSLSATRSRFDCACELQPQNEYMELHKKRHGERLDHDERM
jgi:hypothetical protein